MKISKTKLNELIQEEVHKLHEELGLLETSETNQGADEHKKGSKSKKKHNNGVGDLLGGGDDDGDDGGDAGGDGGGMAESIVEEILNLFAEQIEEQL